MTTKGERKLLRGASARLTALQRGVLEELQRSGASKVWGLPEVTIQSLLDRKLIDRVGRKNVDRPTYVLTDLGRTVLAIRTARTGRATR